MRNVKKNISTDTVIRDKMKILSLGAGVQSTTLLLLSAAGEIPKLDAAIFSDTGWEPASVYKHLNRLDEEIAKPANIPIYRVSAGNIRNDALNPESRFASMPMFVKNVDGSPGMARRECTREYKIKPITRKVRELLGAEVNEHGKVGRVKKGQQLEQWIGISKDEIQRAKDSQVSYIKHRFPLLEMGWSRGDCLTYLASTSFGNTPKSSCIGCPFHGNDQWRIMKNEKPDEWEDAVAFDKAIRNGNPRALANGNELRGKFYLHRSLVPLDEAPVERLTRAEIAMSKGDLFDGEVFTCSPFSCNGDEIEASYGN
jgi:3'-phosphoadenosine 5'-phosphosulfate sulfotransferase (PAPS reductase)/FAD synthetase